MKKIIKVRLFTWFEEVPNQVQPNGDPIYTERISHFGEEVDITNPAYIERGESLNAFYTDEEVSAIKDGTYNGPDALLLSNARAGIRPERLVEAAEGEHGDVASMDAEQLGEYIRNANNGKGLSVPDTLALVPENADEDTINKFLDAENHATDNEPRKGVTDKLEAQLAAAAQA